MTVTPGTALALWSSIVTVIVEAVVPSAGTTDGLACTVDWLTWGQWPGKRSPLVTVTLSSRR